MPALPATAHSQSQRVKKMFLVKTEEATERILDIHTLSHVRFFILQRWSKSAMRNRMMSSG